MQTMMSPQHAEPLPCYRVLTSVRDLVGVNNQISMIHRAALLYRVGLIGGLTTSRALFSRQSQV